MQGPILSKVGDGMQDNLSGLNIQFQLRFCRFLMKPMMVHSLAEVETPYLVRFWFGEGRSLFVHMNGISLDATHSVYADQWDWKKDYSQDSAILPTLKQLKIYKAIRCWLAVRARYDIESILKYTEKLVGLYPDLTPKNVKMLSVRIWCGLPNWYQWCIVR